VKRRWQRACLEAADVALRVKQNEAVKKPDFVGATDAAIKVFEVCAAAESDVLAIVYVLTVGQDVGSCTAAEERTLFE